MAKKISALFLALISTNFLLAVMSQTTIPYMIGYTAKDTTGTNMQLVESWLGRQLDIGGTTMTVTAWYPTDGWPSRYYLSFAIPMLSIPGWDNAGLNDMHLAATGQYDSYYTNMARALSATAATPYAVRIGWEMNGDWYPWSVGGPDAINQSFDNYKAKATIFRREVPGIKIEFCLNWNYYPYGTPLDYWPGNEFVDIISMDIYETLHGDWQHVKSGGIYNLDWLVSFAQQQGVKIALSEWGAANDDGEFITGAAQWMNSLGSLFDYHVYSQYEPADQVVNPGQNPNEQAAWIAAWRNTRYGIPAPTADAPVAVPIGNVPISIPVAEAPIQAPVASSSTYLGCFVDSESRDLPNRLYVGADNTNENCVKLCSDNWYAFAGTQYGKECWCGNAYGSQGQADEATCDMSCTGNDQEKCGGGYRNSVFKTPSRYIGCFVDTATRDLPFKAYDGSNNTPANCKALCANDGYLFAGLQYGEECWCGNSFGHQGGLASESDCDMSGMPCTGDANQNCGSGWRNAIYRV